MRILKMQATRIIAFAVSCLLIGICVFKAVSLPVKYEKLNKNNPVLLRSEEYESYVYSLQSQLWFVGNMYLRYLDENGNFTGSQELKASTERELHKMGLMDSEGNITIDSYNVLEYYVAYGESSLSNSDKKADELSSSEYTLAYANEDLIQLAATLNWWHDNYAYCYSTEYGMYYYYFNGDAHAVFDFDTEGLNSFTDEMGAEIFYKTDGSTPVPEKYESDDYMPNIEISDEGAMYYDEESNIWLKFSNEGFSRTRIDFFPLVIYIAPIASEIEAYELTMDNYVEFEHNAAKTLLSMIPAAIVIVVLWLYVLVAGGYSIKREKFVMCGFDKHIFAEFPLVVIAGAVTCIVLLANFDVVRFIYNLISEYFNQQWLAALSYAIAAAALYALITGMLNSLIVRIKCRGLLKTSLIARLLITLYELAVKALKWFRKHIILRITETIQRHTNNFKRDFFSKEALHHDTLTRSFLIRMSIFLAAELLVLLFTISMYGVETYSIELGIFATIILVACYVYFNLRDLRAMTQLSEHITAIDSGSYEKREVSIDSPIYGMTEKLNNISEGIQKAVDEQIKSERMKIELVTNVSHDLKTPLTSIISYINLLSEEKLTPEAQDYVKILEQKSERLKVMVSDLFDLAKATSRTDLAIEALDAVVLTEQVLADMSDKISASGKEIRKDITVETAPVKGEGKKLYRVLQNLLDNALKYSLEGTRVYLSVKAKDNKALIMVKNIASYEMTFTPDEITERFTRGDKSRTDEGNGLGLSIAKTFTEACGGTFRVIIDGDVFAAEVSLPLTEKAKESNI